MVASLPLACFLSMITPPGVQFENSLLQIAPVDKAKCPYVKEKNDIEFQLYTRHNPTVPQILKVDDDELLFASSIDFHDTTVVYFHAFMENPNDGSAVMVREAYILRGDTNMIMVDASRLEAGPWYFTAAENTWYIGKFAAELIDYLVSRGLDLSRTHLVGHSLGGQAAGVAGSSIKAGHVARITGLDPALPLFAKLPLEQRLDPSDAEFVDVIHTDAGIFGVAEQTGHVDFYPNGGISPQPGCELEVVLKEQMLLNKCENKTQLEYYTFYLKPNQKRSILITKIMKLFNYIQTVKNEGKTNKNMKNLKKYTIPDNLRSEIKRLSDQKDGIHEDMMLPDVDIKTPFNKLKLKNGTVQKSNIGTQLDEDITVMRVFSTVEPKYSTVVSKLSTLAPKISTVTAEINSNAHSITLMNPFAQIKETSKSLAKETIVDEDLDKIIKRHPEKEDFNEKSAKRDGIANVTKQYNDKPTEFLIGTDAVGIRMIGDVRDKVFVGKDGDKNEETSTIDTKTQLTDDLSIDTDDNKRNTNSERKIDDYDMAKVIPVRNEGQIADTVTKIELSDVLNVNTGTDNKNTKFDAKIDAFDGKNIEDTAKVFTPQNEGKKAERVAKIELSDVLNIDAGTDDKIVYDTTKSHVRKRQKRFVNPFKRSEAVESENFLFRMLDFLLKHKRSFIPVFSVMREVNTLVKSANGELNHVTKERNNYIGGPPPVTIPVSYNLELGTENKAVAFMKKLLGLRVHGDKLTISGTGK